MRRHINLIESFSNVLPLFESATFETREPDSGWRERQAAIGNTREVVHPDVRCEALKQTLLSFGGFAANICVDDPDLAMIIKRGQLWKGSGTHMLAGRPVNCHSNSSRLWLDHKTEGYHIITGYALSDDGLWRSHTWGLWKDQIVETTVSRIAYYGFVLTDKEAANFARNNT